MSSMSSFGFAEQVAREMALIMLESPERDETFGNLEAWEYMEIYLCGKRDYQACIHCLRGEAQALARLSSELIWVESLGSKELLALLCNKVQQPEVYEWAHLQTNVAFVDKLLHILCH